MAVWNQDKYGPSHTSRESIRSQHQFTCQNSLATLGINDRYGNHDCYLCHMFNLKSRGSELDFEVNDFHSFSFS
jgi:hypothetical protein